MAVRQLARSADELSNPICTTGRADEWVDMDITSEGIGAIAGIKIMFENSAAYREETIELSFFE
ncbi:MAG: hypothetical protein AWU57_1281 [Marinobacter sp. T13-3]|nr:MAG: hypothetical protein AWU57_1281 [Marinobacter sp. T13-3]